MRQASWVALRQVVLLWRERMGKIRLRLLSIAGAALLSPLVARAAVPIALTPGSFNQDAVVEATAVNDATTHYSTSVTATMDGGTAKNGGGVDAQGPNTPPPPARP